MLSADFFAAHILLMFLLPFFLFSPARAGEIDEAEFSLGRIIISATRAEIAEELAADDVIVFEKREIEQLPARNAADVLFYLPGIDTDDRGRFGQPSTVSIRGSRSRHVLVMVDGIPFNTQLSGQANPSKIPLENIKRIEVIKGAASSVWGSSLGGVINFITEDVGIAEGIQGEITSSVAEFQTFSNALTLKGKIGGTGYLMTVNRFSSDGIHSDSSIDENKFYSKIKHDLGDQADITASFGYSGGDVWNGVLLNNRFYNTPYISRYGKIELGVEQEAHDFSMAYKYNDQDITSDTYNAATRQLETATISNNIYHAITVKDHVQINDNILTAGMDLEWHTIKSSNYLGSAKSVAMQAPYINYLINIDQWHITPGIRYDHNNQFGDQVSPSLGVVYELRDAYRTKARAKVSRAFNAPPLMWIYNNDPAILVAPNPDLDAERGISYEAGLNSTIGNLNLDVSVYRVDVKKALKTDFDSALGMYIFRNLENVRRQGVEARVDYDLNQRWDFYASAGYNDAENRTTGEDIRGAGVAIQSFRFGCIYQHENGWQVHLSGYYDRFDNNASDEPNDRKPMFDLRVSKDIFFSRYSIDSKVFINIYNLTNADYWHNKLYPYPERYIEGGFQIRF